MAQWHSFKMLSLNHMTMSSTDRLHELQQLDLSLKSAQIIRAGGKQARQDSHKKALVALHLSFEDAFVEAATLALGLNSGQAKKVRYKKDRIRLFKAKGLDYLAIDGAETAFVLAQIAQAINFEDAIVTDDLHDIFPFWKSGWPMVQFDNAYKILAEDIQLHYNDLLKTLLQLDLS